MVRRDAADTYDTKVLKIHKNNGKFYNSYNEDAWLLSYLFDYKLIDGVRAGFPDVAIERVKERLEEEKISYKIDYADGEIVEKDFAAENRYDEIFAAAKKFVDIKMRLDDIIRKLERSDLEDLVQIMDIIEEYYRKK